MIYKRTFLNTSALVYFIFLIGYTIFNYSTLTAGEGWGIVAMVGLSIVGLIALAADAVLQQIIKNRKWLNALGMLVGLIIALVFSVHAR